MTWFSSAWTHSPRLHQDCTHPLLNEGPPSLAAAPATRQINCKVSGRLARPHAAIVISTTTLPGWDAYPTRVHQLRQLTCENHENMVGMYVRLYIHATDTETYGQEMEASCEFGWQRTAWQQCMGTVMMLKILLVIKTLYPRRFTSQGHDPTSRAVGMFTYQCSYWPILISWNANKWRWW